MLFKLKKRITGYKRELRYWRFIRWLKKHPKADEIFSGLDRYYPKWDGLDYALNYCCSSLRILKCDARNCERYRQSMLRMKILLIRSGLSKDAIETADWAEGVLGINCLDSLINKDIGSIVIQQVKSGASPEGIRQVIVDAIFGSSIV